MKDHELVVETINKIPKCQPFSAKSLKCEVSLKNVRRILSRLVKKGVILRAVRGVYARPEYNRYVGAVPPGTAKIVEFIAEQTGEVIETHGVDSVRLLGLSTQVAVKPIYYTTGRNRYIKINDHYGITLQHISPRKLIKPGTVTCFVVLALRYAGRKNVNMKTIKTIQSRLKPEHFSEVLKHVELMPAWMAVVFERYQNKISASTI